MPQMRFSHESEELDIDIFPQFGRTHHKKYYDMYQLFNISNSWHLFDATNKISGNVRMVDFWFDLTECQAMKHQNNDDYKKLTETYGCLDKLAAPEKIKNGQIH